MIIHDERTPLVKFKDVAIGGVFKSNDLIKRLTAMKTCTECQIKGKPCEDNCKWQYEAGTMGEIVQTLEQTIKALKQMDTLDKIRAEIKQVEINGHIRDVECFSAGINTALNIIDKYRGED